MKKLFFTLIVALLSACKNEEITFFMGEFDEVSKKCRLTDVSFTFKVDSQRQEVMQTVIEKEKIVGTEFLDKCKILDTNNFVCGGEYSTNASHRADIWSMSNGKIHYESAYFTKDSDRKKETNCWYKKTFFGNELIID
jgi:hypothetical protein